MIFRRDFLRLGRAAGSRCLLPMAPLSAVAAPALAAQPLFRLVHDSRADSSRAEALRLGTALVAGRQDVAALLRAMSGDVTRFWFDELQPVWRQQRAAVAGTTAPDVLFCLEQLARDHRLRVQWRTPVTPAGDLSLLSWLIAAA